MISAKLSPAQRRWPHRDQPAGEVHLKRPVPWSLSRPPPTPPTALHRSLSWLGAWPWWISSTIFHFILLILFTLLAMAIPKAVFIEDFFSFSISNPPPERVKPPEPLTRVPRYAQAWKLESSNSAEIPIETAAYESPVLVYEQIDISDHMEVPGDPGETLATQGEEGFTDFSLSDSGIISTVGLGSGGTGAYGRPLLPTGRLRRAIRGGGGKQTESAVDRGLEWLAKNQEADGHWDTRKHGATGSKWCDTSSTGFAVLAFLGAGHTERVGKYKDNLRRAIHWLIAQQQADGALRPSAYPRNLGYANAIAGMALAEAAAMARVPETLSAAQRALDYGITHQQEVGGEKQGYRYLSQQAGDISNTAWYIMQLKSAKVGQLKVPEEAFKGVARFLDRVEDRGFRGAAGDQTDNGRHRYGYTQSNQVTHRRGSMGCLTRQFMGAEPEELRGGVEWFMQSGGIPAAGREDLYYWYYGTLCTFQQGGDVWKRWNQGLMDALVPTQRQDGDFMGSWDPSGPFALEWGRVGQTALAVMCLEVYYRYLPMYR